MAYIIREARHMWTGELEGYYLNGKFVPIDEMNDDYQLIKKLVQEDGIVPEPAYNPDEWLNMLKFKLKKRLKEIVNEKYNKSVIYSQTLQAEIDAGLIALNNIDALISIMNDTDTIDFRLADNTFVKVNKQQLLDIRKEIILAGIELYQKKWRIEKLIDSATSYEDLLNTRIDFENEKLVKEG